MKQSIIILGIFAICVAGCKKVQKPFWETDEPYKVTVRGTSETRHDGCYSASYFTLLEAPSVLENGVKEMQKGLTTEKFVSVSYENGTSEDGTKLDAWNLSADTFYQVGKYLTLKYSWSIYTIGAAHGLYGVYNAVFDKETGAQVSVSDLVVDTAQLRTVGFECFKEQNVEIFENNDEQELRRRFFIPNNFAVTPQGLEFYFELYDIVSYAEGLVSFTVSYDKLK
jgi:hypothetical protein